MLWRTVALSIPLLFVCFPVGATDSGVPPAVSGEPSPDAVIAEVPFLRSDEPNRILVDLAPDNYAPLRMMIDTGAADSVLTPRYAQKLGVSVERLRDTPYRRATRLGRDLQFWVDVKSSDTASKTGWEYGLLGGTFLREYVVEFDFAGRHVRFLNPERYRVPQTVTAEDEAVVPVRVVENRVLVEVSFEGKPLALLIDTGSPDTAILSGAAAHKVGINSAPLPGMRAGTVWGPMEVEFAEAESLRLGPFELQHVPVMVAPKGWYNMGSSTDSVIGYDVLSQFLVRIDYPRQRLWLRRRSDTEVTYCGVPYALQRRAGLLVCPSSRGLWVLGLFPDSDAAHLGILPGDFLLPPAGEKPEGAASKTLQAIVAGGHLSAWRQQNGTPVEVSLPGRSRDSAADDSKH